MDKLKPLIKHHYWICFAFAVIFSLVGWWLGSGSLSAAIATRKTAVDGAFTKAGQGGDAPNQRWIDAAKKLNEGNKKAYDESSTALWQRQKLARIWYKDENEDLNTEMKNIPYFGPIARSSTRSKWGYTYQKQFEQLLKIVDPFQMKDGTGLVLVNPRTITSKLQNQWRLKRPVSDEVWKNQEDIWLLKSLLTSIARVNEGASRITDASLRQIVRLQLRGGDREYKPAAGGGMGGAMGGEMDPMMKMMMGGEGGGMPGDMEAGGGAAGGGRGGAGTAWKRFEGKINTGLLDEEFGPLSGRGAGGMAAAGATGADAGMPGDMANPMEMMMMGGAMGGGQAVEPKRYVDDQDTLPYKTRAFQLHVKIREDQVPRLLAQLGDSDFPVEIVRVDLRTSAGSVGGGRGGIGGAMSGGPAGDGMMGPGMPAMMGMPGDMEMKGGMDMGMPGDMEMGMSGDMGMSGEMEMGMAGDMGMGMPGDMGMGMPGDMEMAGPMAMMGGAGADIYGGAAGGYPGDLEGGGAAGAFGPGAMGAAYGAMGMPGQAGGNMRSQTGQQARAAALSDPALVDLRVAGLMTLYQSKEEVVAETKTEAAAATEATESGPPVPPAPGIDGSAAAPGPEAPSGDTPAPGDAPPGETPSGTAIPIPGEPAEPSPLEPSAPEPGAETPAAEEAAADSIESDPALPGTGGETAPVSEPAAETEVEPGNETVPASEGTPPEQN